MPKITVMRSIVIDATIDKVFATVRDFKQWRPWSPWLIAEPGCEMRYAEDGSSYSWDGNIIGAGGMEIVSEDAPRSIVHKLTFLKPWKSQADVHFHFAARAGGTEVTWTMDGSLPFFMFLFKRMMEGFIGMDYQRGLAMLKDYVQTGGVPSKLEFPGCSARAGFSYAGVRTGCAVADIGARMREDMAKLGDWSKAAGAEPAGAPFAIYHKWSVTKGTTAYTLGVPLRDVPAELPAGLVSGAVPDCEVYAVSHTGAYGHLGNAWAAGMMHARAKRFRKNGRIPPFEIYENDPGEVAESELLTLVCFPAKHR